MISDENKEIYTRLFKTLKLKDCRKETTQRSDLGQGSILKRYDTQVTFTWDLESFLKVEAIFERFDGNISLRDLTISDNKKDSYTFAKDELDWLPTDWYTDLKSYVNDIKLPLTKEQSMGASVKMYLLGNGL